MKVCGLVTLLLLLALQPAFAGKKTTVHWAKPCMERPEFVKPVFQQDFVGRPQFDRTKFEAQKYDHPQLDRMKGKNMFEGAVILKPQIEKPFFDGKCPRDMASTTTKRTYVRSTVDYLNANPATLVQQKPAAPCPCTAENAVAPRKSLPN